MKSNKYFTFSFDDGTEQDIRLIELLNKYNLKGTFNLNSATFGNKGTIKRAGKDIQFNKILACDVKHIYAGHEVAGHTLNHALLPSFEKDEDIIYEVEQDRLNLSDVCGYEIVGFAYSSGGANYDTRCAELIKKNTGVKYARTIKNNYSFHVQENLFEFEPTTCRERMPDLFSLAEKFFSTKSEEKQIFYFWGHAFEFDIDESWGAFEEFLQFVSNRKDVIYGTNKEVLL